MAKKESGSQEAEYDTVEKLKERCKIPDAVHDGICAANGWRKGRTVSIEEYRTASQKFLKTAIGGKR